ncbi:MAG: peptide ABC transporter substrate-binding protein [Acidimicrobiia bacterium]
MNALHTKRVARWMCVLAVLSLILAACAGTTGGTTTTEAVEPTTTVAEATTTTEFETTEGDCPDAFCVLYHINPDAAWSDGTPVTADDFAFTYETTINPDLEITSRDGYDKMTGYDVVDDKTFLAIFGEVYAPWRTLFANPGVMPKHALEGESFNEVWDDGIEVGSGPFVMDEWVKDERITLSRNPNYWASEDPLSGSPLGDVQTVNIVFIEDSQTQVQALRGQEIDMFYPQPQVTLVEDVSAIDGVEWEASLGPIWENLSFNHDDPLLSQKFIRQAFAMGIDREAIVDVVVRPLAPDAEVLNNTIWMLGTTPYEDHLTQYPYDPAAAEAVLVDNGCVKGGDGIYECSGERLSFNWTTTAGNEGRELQFELAQANLAQMGIEVNAAFGPASEVFADEYFYGDSSVWQLFNFGWVGAPDPVGSNTIYYCEGGAPSGFGDLNMARYCNEEVDSLIHQTDTVVEPEDRAALYNQADSLYLDDVAALPLYQKPTFFAWRGDIEGPKDNATQAGPFWNIGSWSGKEIVTFGADQQPESMNIWEPDGNLFAANLVAAAVLEGAYGIAPDFSYVPQLVESAEPIVPSGG